MSDVIRLRTFAKVNLYLRVLGRRPDGYHEIETILHGISLADELEVTVTGGGGVDVTVHADGIDARDLPRGEANLVARASHALEASGVAVPGVRARILKRIPVGAGLGGGSANAAGMLVALNELLELGLGPSPLGALAATIGSDVTYCMVGGTALATGRGESVQPLPACTQLWLVLGVSDAPLPTGTVYEAWDALARREAAGPAAASMTLALGAGDGAEIARLLHNDLAAAASSLRPDLPAKLARMREAGALGAGVTGSGPTVFGLAPDEAAAKGVAEAVRDDFDRVLVAASSGHATERLD